MRFEYYHDGLTGVPKLSVDGTVPNSLQLSHWQGNETPAELKADTSTEIALNYVASAARDDLTRGIEIVTNNHFDTDGVLSVWTVLEGERALELKERLIPAAESGDFSEWTTPDGIRASIIIQGSEQPASHESTLSPLADYLAGRTVEDEREAYELVLPEVPRVLTRTSEYETLWRSTWSRLEKAMESFERGASKVTEDAGAKLSIITLSDELYGPDGFDPSRHAVPFTAISRYVRGHLYLIAVPAKSGGWFYRIDYPYYSWAETIVRPRIARSNFSNELAELNELEKAEGSWRADKSELSSAVKFLNQAGVLAASKLRPDEVAEVLRRALMGREAAAVSEVSRHG